MTTVKSLLAGLALATALAPALVPGAARAQSLTLVHGESIYADEKKGALRYPEGVACTASGRVVVADSGNARLVTYALKDGRVGGGAVIALPEKAQPVRVELDRAGNVFVLDRKTRSILRVGEDGAVKPVQAKGAPAQILPVAFKLDAADRLHVLDGASRAVLVLDAEGNVGRKLDLPREGGAVFTDVALDAAGTIYAVDGVNAVVWAADKAATAFRQLSTRLEDVMSFPAYATVSPRGALLLVDQTGNGIVTLGPDGSFQGRQLAVGWDEGLVQYPGQLCLTGDQVLLADRNNHRVQVFTAR